jgi:hypothetical protein
MKDQALYLEADEDITSAIDKLAKSSGDAVQIVVPKRSTLLQSIINQKLLKKAAADQRKQLVIVTTDKVAIDLAARVGLAVAPSLGAKSVLTEATPAPRAEAEEIIEDDQPGPAPANEPAPAAEPSKPAKSLLDRLPKLPKRAPTEAPPEPPAPDPDPEPDDEPAPAKGPKLKLGAPKVPNFGSLQRRILWIVLAVAVVAGYLVYMSLFTRASVTLFAAGTRVAVDTSFSVDPSQSASNVTSGVLAGQTVTFSKDLSQAFTPTGQLDQGTKASGQMTISNTYDMNSHQIVAGTRLSSPDGHIFLTNSDVTVPGATLSGGQVHAGTVSVGVTAAQNGDGYNQAPAKYTIVAYSGAMQADIYGQGAQMSGGTSKLVTAVGQSDVDAAQTAMLAADKDAGQKSLDAAVPSGFVAMPSSTTVTASAVTPAPAVGQAASNANLSIHVTYTELAVKKTDYDAFITARELAQVGAGNQIYDDGLASADVTSTGKDAGGRMQFHLSTNAYSGAKIDQAALAKALAGKKYGDASDIASGQPGVQHVNISLSPAWSTGLPHNPAKIKITIQVASSS